MKYLVTAEEMKRYDQNTIETIGIPGLVLMERAALCTYQHLKNLLNNKEDPRILIVCGVGNNGGDGLAVARLLLDDAYPVDVWIVGDTNRASEQWTVQRSILEAYQDSNLLQFCDEVTEHEYTVVVDALFGVGLSRNLEREYAEAIEICNGIKALKVAIDVPSGIHSDHGKVMGVAFFADITVTFGFGKRGLFVYPGCDYAGKVYIEKIGINEKAFLGNIPQMFYYDEPVRELMPYRDEKGNKGTFGKVLLIAGSKNMAGAAILAAKAAFCAGCGMVKILSDADNRIILQQAVPDAMFGEYNELLAAMEWCDVIAAGPGMSQSNEAKVCLKKVIELCNKPLVLDADVLNLIAKSPEGIHLLKQQTEKKRQIVLTPHPGELSRLMKTEVSSLKEEPIGKVAEFATETGCIIVEKDAKTLVFEPNGRICLNIVNNSGLAVAGSGDVLCGLITGILAQKEDAFEAACCGVALHSALGKRERSDKSAYGMTASDLVSRGLYGIFHDNEKT